MEIVERVLRRKIRSIVNVHAIQFDFVPGTRDVLFVVRRMQKYRDIKLCKCFMYIKKVFD